MELQKKKVLVAGTGISGIGAGKLLMAKGADVTLYDGNQAVTREAVLEKMGCEVKTIIGEMTKEMAGEFELMVLSPGISAFGPLAMTFKEAGVPIWGEIELAYQVGKGKIAAITGTNGKTTTTALVGEILKAGYEKAFVVGNIGIPYTSVALETTEDCAIAAEISSFQLETICDFCPEVSAVLNLTPDHLDRHGSMEVYGETKLAISKNQKQGQVLVLNFDDLATRAMGARTKASVFYFSRKEELHHGAYLKGDKFIVSIDGEQHEICTLSDLNLLGVHNYENVLAAISVAWFMGVPAEIIRDTIRKFQAVEHRMEYVATVNGVVYYNDSKGTNPDASIKAVEAMDRKTVVIGGGYDKGVEFDAWIQSFGDKVTWLVLIGATADQIEETAKRHGFTNIVKEETFEAAVRTASEKAKEGEAVLLSPACASWGMFPNYEVRGRQFKELVGALKAE